MANTMIISPQHGKFYFDAVLKTEIKKELTLTSHPIQSGASVTDHSYFEPDTVTLEIGFSDVYGESGTSDHSTNAFKRLEAIMEEREPVTLVTRFNTYSSMVLTGLSVPDEYAMMTGMRATLDFTEIKIVYAKIVSVQKKVRSGKSNTYAENSINVESLGKVEDDRSWFLIASDMLYEYSGIDLQKTFGFSRTSSMGSGSSPSAASR